MYKIIAFLLLCSTFSLRAQTISGNVYDEAHVAIEGAVVYFDGTTISAVTDTQGHFTIKADKDIPAALIVNSIGYKRAKIDTPFTGKPLEIILTADAIVMEEAVVTGRTVFSRKQMLKAFREQFLGQSRAGTSCKIENEDDIYLRFDTSNNILYAEASKPLRIINNRLKYIVTFDLVASEIRYRTKSLNPFYISGAFFGGTTFFIDVSAKGNADKPRKEAYLGSPMHFVQTAINEDWEEQKFTLYQNSLPIDPKQHFVIEDTLTIKKITIKEPVEESNITLTNKKGKKTIVKQRFEVRFNKEYESFVLYDKGIFYANSNGLFWPLQELTFGGYMGNLRVGDLLPADYRLKE